MEEFAKMIYEQCRSSQDGEDFDQGDYDEEWKRLYDILNEKVATNLECSVNKRVWEIEEKAFIAGFGYACKCLSNGKVNLGGGNNV